MTEPIDVHKIFAEYFKGREALAYALSSKLAEGNICIDIDDYKSELPGLLEEQKAKEYFIGEYTRFWPSPEDFEKQCIPGDYVTNYSEELKPFVVQGRNAYLHRYFKYETAIIDNIKRLGNNFHIITGGPGSGKTYSVSAKLVELLGGKITLKIALAAPTGKAAARMNESIKKFTEDPDSKIREDIKTRLTELKAQTIHRLLGSKPDSVFFKYDETNRLPYDVVIIDECSMVDGAMMAKLLNAVEKETILYLIGDKDQLASVEAGSVFGDICRARNSKLLKAKVELKTESHRFDPEKGIGKFSKLVIDGTFKDLKVYDNDEQITFDASYSDDLFKQYALKYKDYIVETDIKEALKKLNHVRFLCVTRENDHSVSEYNKKIQYYLSKQIEGFKPRSEGFYHNQPVIITQNDYKLGIFNGDVGIIREKETESGKVLVAYFETADGKLKEIQAGYLNHYETVFAMTIHKSQGSEFDNVVVVLPEKQGEKLLTRELLYTGVTRAISKALIQSTEEILFKCAAKSVSRASGLEERLNNE